MRNKILIITGAVGLGCAAIGIGALLIKRRIRINKLTNEILQGNIQNLEIKGEN